MTKLSFREFANSRGEVILYTGEPNLERLEELSLQNGHLWHSSFEQGYKNAFNDVVYFTSVFFWYVSDFDYLDEVVSWRLNPNMFAIRKEIWDLLGGFDEDYESFDMQAIDYAYNGLKNSGLIPLYVKGLYSKEEKYQVSISTRDRYVFYRKNYQKIDHSLYMLFMKGVWNPKEILNFIRAYKGYTFRSNIPVIPLKELKPLVGAPTVSYIIPTMNRQDYTLRLLEDLREQSYRPTQVIVVDATRPENRDESLYVPNNYPFEVIFKWQTSKGSCRARNEAIELCTGEYIVFGDDDIRVPSDFIENHMRFMQTYNVGANLGLDVRADHEKQDLSDLSRKLEEMKTDNSFRGVTNTFNNANSCVLKKHVDQLGGNDINFDGGYGEDADFGLSLIKLGVLVLRNPHSADLHLKPPAGGYRVWAQQARVLGKKRKEQPWELDTPVKYIRPVPSPTKMYEYYKHFNDDQLKIHKSKYLIMYLFKGKPITFLFRLLNLPYRILQFNTSEFYAKKLINLGVRIK